MNASLLMKPGVANINWKWGGVVRLPVYIANPNFCSERKAGLAPSAAPYSSPAMIARSVSIPSPFSDEVMTISG